MPRYSAKIEVGDLVELRSQHKLQKFYTVWNVTGIVTKIYISKRGKDAGKEMAKIYFATKQVWGFRKYETVPFDKEVNILLKRLKKVRNK